MCNYYYYPFRKLIRKTTSKLFEFFYTKHLVYIARFRIYGKVVKVGTMAPVEMPPFSGRSYRRAPT